MNTVRALRSFAAIGSAVSLLVLSSFVFPGPAAALGLDDLQVKSIPPAALEKVVEETSSNPQAIRAYSLLIAANASISLADTYLTLALGSWSPALAKSYSAGGTTFTWKREGNHWTWSWAGRDESGPQTFVTDVVESGTSYDIKIRVNNGTFLTGTVNRKGASGTVTIDSSPGGQNPETFTTRWEPDASPYATKFTVSGRAEAPLGSVVLHCDDPGTRVRWSYVP